ncbi:MAG: cytochrome b5 domain-containing protein [Acholeplasmataceae bacterium]|nr:cytochrome b5 domain-containing protein [Acholeplasmataceae bacterium]
MKKLYLFVVLISVLTLSACANESSPTIPVETEPIVSDPVETELPTMTLAELSAFDGKNGAKAYVAISGYVYDVTNSVYWPNGNHNGYQAGRDLTIPLNQSPHGIANVQRFPIVAKLASGG